MSGVGKSEWSVRVCVVCVCVCVCVSGVGGWCVWSVVCVLCERGECACVCSDVESEVCVCV